MTVFSDYCASTIIAVNELGSTSEASSLAKCQSTLYVVRRESREERHLQDSVPASFGCAGWHLRSHSTCVREWLPEERDQEVEALGDGITVDDGVGMQHRRLLIWDIIIQLALQLANNANLQ